MLVSTATHLTASVEIAAAHPFRDAPKENSPYRPSPCLGQGLLVDIDARDVEKASATLTVAFLRAMTMV
jgi:hypothetical protein